MRASHTKQFDRRLFIFGIFLLLLALGTVDGPRGDASWRLVITEQMLAFGRLHLPQWQPGLVQTPSGWTSYFAIGQTLLFIPFKVAGKIMSVLRLPALPSFPITYLYCPLIGAAYFLALLALLEAFGLSARTAGVATARQITAMTLHSVTGNIAQRLPSWVEQFMSGLLVAYHL